MAALLLCWVLGYWAIPGHDKSSACSVASVIVMPLNTFTLGSCTGVTGLSSVLAGLSVRDLFECGLFFGAS
jgi:hypothetical protein